MDPSPAVPLRVSVVVPLFEEQENVAPLVDAVQNALDPVAWSWELVLVDDGSADGTLSEARKQRKKYGPHITVLPLRRNFGQTAAMQAGLDAARGSVCVTLDGDLQNDPSDIPAMVDRLVGSDLDLVVGWRKTRHDGWLLRRLPSVIANRLIRKVTGVRVHDYGCSLKVYRTSLVRQMRLYGEMHRFIPAWAAMVTAPARIEEMEVRHHPRRSGRSKYGLGRVTRVMLDLLVVHFFLRYRATPGHFFGAIGLVMGGLGTAGLAWLAWVKFVVGEDIGGRPMLLTAILLVIGALQFITTGVVTELLARAWLGSSGANSYVVHEEIAVRAGDADWAGA